MNITGQTDISITSKLTPRGALIQHSAYDLSEEAGLNLDRTVAPGQVQRLEIVPDVDIASAIKYIKITGAAQLAFALETRTYTTRKNETASGTPLAFAASTLVAGTDVSGAAQPGELTLVKPVQLIGCVHAGLMLDNGNNPGVPRRYTEILALPLTLVVHNRGLTPAVVSVQTVYDPTPGAHVGAM